MKKIDKYRISCQTYNWGMSYEVSIWIPNTVNFIQVNIKDCETGLSIINEHIKDYEFTIIPDLTIYPSPILGDMIYAENGF